MTIPGPAERLWLRLLSRATRNYAWADVDGIRMFGTRRHERYLSRLRRGRVEPFTAGLFREAVTHALTVVDVGAYLGYYTLLAARAGASVYSFECNPANFRYLSHNVSLNNCERSVSLSSAAVADHERTVSFYVHSWDMSEGSLWKKDATRDVVEVPGTTLDTALGRRHVDVLKMDIEGGEVRALAGMTGLLSSSPNLVAFIECNPAALASAGSSAAELTESLASAGFRVRQIDERERRLAPVDLHRLTAGDPDDTTIFANLYCTRY